MVLEPFAHGVYSAHSNATEAVHLIDYPLVCFELEAVKSHPKLYPLVVQTLFALAFEIVEAHPEKKKFIDIEEGWAMLDDYSEENIEAFFRKGRKTQTSIRLITQDIEEIQGSMGKFLGMSDLELAKYGSLRRTHTYREVLIKEMDVAQVWQVAVSPHEHALLTSKPEERDRLTQLITDNGDLQRGVEVWVGERR